MPETTALGAAMAAGAAEGVSVWSLCPEDLSEVTSEKFEPQINCEGLMNELSTQRCQSFKLALMRLNYFVQSEDN